MTLEAACNETEEDAEGNARTADVANLGVSGLSLLGSSAGVGCNCKNRLLVYHRSRLGGGYRCLFFFAEYDTMWVVTQCSPTALFFAGLKVNVRCCRRCL